MQRSNRRVLVITLVALVAVTPLSLQARTIVVYGASGPIGGLIVKEALSRGDSVIGVSRTPSKLKFKDANFKAVQGDVTNLESFESVTQGSDAVIISVGGVGKDNAPEHTAQAQAAQVAVRAFTGVPDSPYVIQIGGATTMWGNKEAMLAHLRAPEPGVPAFAVEPGSVTYAMLFGHLVELQTYRASRIRWTVLTPPMDIEGHRVNAPPVPMRTGKYRTSTTSFVRDANGKSRVNIADLAVAAVDEAEHPRFVGKRFTIGY